MGHTSVYWFYLFTNTHTQTIPINICSPPPPNSQLGSNEADCAAVRWMGNIHTDVSSVMFAPDQAAEAI